MLLQRFRQTCGGAYNVEEALQRQNLKRKDIEAVREKLKSVAVVPKFLVDNQVKMHFFVVFERFIYTKFIF